MKGDEKMDTTKDFRARLSRFNKTYCGLDLGTYRNIIGYRRGENEPEAVFDLQGHDLNTRGGVPSLVWIDKNGKVTAGGAAEKAKCQEVDPFGTCASPKMKLRQKEIILHGKSYKPAEILKILVEDIREESFREMETRHVSTAFTKLVVGRPARFTAAENGTLRDVVCAVFPGIEVRIVPEPILAAVYHRFYTNESDRPLLVFDMGAGTFDVCWLEKNLRPTTREPHPFLVKNPDGSRVAGNQIDELLAELILKKLERESPASARAGLKTLKDPAHADHTALLLAAREVKENLSSRDMDNFLITTLEGKTWYTMVKRTDFEAVIRTSIQKNVDLAYEVLQKSRAGKPDVDILMVGASCYIPLVRKLLEEAFPWLPPERIMLRDPEKAVALGAAIYASEPDIVDTTPVSYAYAIMTYSMKDSKDMLHVRIPTGAKLPCTTQSTYHTRYEGQTHVNFEIYEVQQGVENQMMDLQQGKATGYSISHPFGRAVPRGTQVLLTATVDENGLLTMQVDDLDISDNPPTKLVVNNSNNVPA